MIRKPLALTYQQKKIATVSALTVVFLTAAFYLAGQRHHASPSITFGTAYINANANDNTFIVAPSAAARVAGINPVTGNRYNESKCFFHDKDLHHPSLLQFDCWSGIVPDFGSSVNPSGVIVPSRMWKRTSDRPPFRQYHHSAEFPSPSQFQEEYFQMICAAEAVLSAKDQLVVMELGANWGRWLLTAFHFNMQKRALPVLLIGVEGEMMRHNDFKAAMSYNSLRPYEFVLFEAVVAENDGETYFCGSAAGTSEWYGQSITTSPDTEACKTGIEGVIGTTIRVRSLSLKTLLEPHERVDYLDLDIQYAELVVVNSTKAEIDKKVARIIIEVHDLDQMDDFIRIFIELNWVIEYALRADGYNSMAHTKHGDLLCSGGMIYARNPKLT